MRRTSKKSASRVAKEKAQLAARVKHRRYVIKQLQTLSAERFEQHLKRNDEQHKNDPPATITYATQNS